MCECHAKWQARPWSYLHEKLQPCVPRKPAVSPPLPHLSETYTTWARRPAWIQEVSSKTRQLHKLRQAAHAHLCSMQDRLRPTHLCQSQRCPASSSRQRGATRTAAPVQQSGACLDPCPGTASQCGAAPAASAAAPPPPPHPPPMAVVLCPTAQP
jgi:hypothetical protein